MIMVSKSEIQNGEYLVRIARESLDDLEKACEQNAKELSDLLGGVEIGKPEMNITISYQSKQFKTFEEAKNYLNEAPKDTKMEAVAELKYKGLPQDKIKEEKKPSSAASFFDYSSDTGMRF